MQVFVDDRNDNAPVFQNSVFSTSISEVSPVFVGQGMGSSPGRCEAGNDRATVYQQGPRVRVVSVGTGSRGSSLLMRLKSWGYSDLGTADVTLCLSSLLHLLPPS